MRRVQGGHTTVPERGARAHNARTRPTEHRVPAEIMQAVMQSAHGCDRLTLSPKRGACGQVPGQQTTLTQQADCARVAAGQRASLGLHVPETAAWENLREGPGDWSQLAMQSEHRDRALERTDRELRRQELLDRLHGVLEARVVELHHVCTRRALARKPAREVDVDNVEAA